MGYTTNGTYSSTAEANEIFRLLCASFDPIALPPLSQELRSSVQFTALRDLPYFPIPFKETETGAALKAIEACVACLIANLRTGTHVDRSIEINLEKTTAFLCQAYMAKVGGRGKLDTEVKEFLKDTDLLQAQSNPYRRMSANLYATKTPGQYYHIHGSLEASTTLQMIGLEPYRPDLKTVEEIVSVIEPAVQKFSIEELEALNSEHRQAGVAALKHDEFMKTRHGASNVHLPPWSVDGLENETPKCPFPANSIKDNIKPLADIKVLELCRIIAGPVITRILAEYGADVLKITSPALSDVPFFQVDGNMGKHAADLDLKTPEGREIFEELLAEADVVVDGYRPGALERLGFGSSHLVEIAKKRGKGFVYVNENCFGYHGEWAHRPGWQQIADCVTGVAWEQGRFMGLDEPVVPPFPISDYGTGCIGAITALVGLYHRATKGGSWHGKASLLHYDLLLFKVGLLPDDVQEQLRQAMGTQFLSLRHSHSVDQISGTALRKMHQIYPSLFDESKYLERWHSAAYEREVKVVSPVVDIDMIEVGFSRASRPNGTDRPSWDFGKEDDIRLE